MIKADLLLQLLLQVAHPRLPAASSGGKPRVNRAQVRDRQRRGSWAGRGCIPRRPGRAVQWALETVPHPSAAGLLLSRNQLSRLAVHDAPPTHLPGIILHQRRQRLICHPHRALWHTCLSARLRRMMAGAMFVVRVAVQGRRHQFSLWLQL